MTEEKRICSKCDKIIKDDHKFCPSCGGKVVNKEEHRVKGVKKRKLWLYFVIPIVLILIIGSIVIFAIPFQYKATEAYDVQEPYTDYETYYVNVPYTITVKNPNCTFGILCDLYIEETRYREKAMSRSVTKYKTVQKEREVWKKDTLYNMWTGKTQYWYKV
ncbi:hypothetical protein J4444_04705 [Candidatus Woesearchaeota archaeon]|nr:hypothetical protein [Candidatus Woesearchaeota archaeon]